MITFIEAYEKYYKKRGGNLLTLQRLIATVQSHKLKDLSVTGRTLITPNTVQLDYIDKWLINLLLSKKMTECIMAEDLYKLFGKDGYINKFEKLKKGKKISGKEADINTYNTISELGAFVLSERFNDYLSRKTKGELSKDINSTYIDSTEYLYEDDDWLIVSPQSYEASCYWGKDTQWCTATRSSRMYYDSYTERGKLYININKKSGEKYQFHFESNSFMNSKDITIDRTVKNMLYNIYKGFMPKVYVMVMEHDAAFQVFSKKYYGFSRLHINLNHITELYDEDGNKIFECHDNYYILNVINDYIITCNMSSNGIYSSEKIYTINGDEILPDVEKSSINATDDVLKKLECNLLFAINQGNNTIVLDDKMHTRFIFPYIVNIHSININLGINKVYAKGQTPDWRTAIVDEKGKSYMDKFYKLGCTVETNYFQPDINKVKIGVNTNWFDCNAIYDLLNGDIRNVNDDELICNYEDSDFNEKMMNFAQAYMEKRLNEFIAPVTTRLWGGVDIAHNVPDPLRYVDLSLYGQGTTAAASWTNYNVNMLHQPDPPT